MKSETKVYIRSILIALGVGAVSAYITRNNMDVYSTVEKPSLAPPGWVFPVVWTVLYILMGVSAAIVFNKGKREGIYTFPALKVYAIQLIVNFFWSIIFFNCRSFLFAFIWLLLLVVLVGIMIYRFYGVSKVAAILNIPYFIWTLFASYLSFMIYILNI